LSVLKWSHAHLQRRWKEFVGVISHSTSFTPCPVPNLILAWFGWKLVGDLSFSTNLWPTTLCRFRKRMQLNRGGLRWNTLFLYFVFHHLYLFLLFIFFNFPSCYSLYLLFLYSFFFYFILQHMLIHTGLSWCHKFQLHFISLMPQIKGTFFKIERFKNEAMAISKEDDKSSWE